MDRKTYKTEINDWLKNYFIDKGSYNKKLYEAMSYSVEVGGKRIRPILLILTYLLYKKDCERVMPVAGAIELIHTYSLIHDDLPSMDNDDLRRGKPTNHIMFGEAVAILAGDALLNEAMNILFNFCKHGEKNYLKACTIISEAAGAEGMIGGQIVDILSEGKNISTDELTYMHSMKTGALIKCSILAGGILGNAPNEELEVLGLFGEKLGLAFQIKDDILDSIGDTSVLGKNIKSDVENDKTTFITIYGIEKCIEICKRLTKESINLMDKLKGDTTELKVLILFLLEREF